MNLSAGMPIFSSPTPMLIFDTLTIAGIAAAALIAVGVILLGARA